MRASTSFVVAFAASAYAAGVDSTSMFDEITAPQGAEVEKGKHTYLPPTPRLSRPVLTINQLLPM
jgi:hypothetical protein